MTFFDIFGAYFQKIHDNWAIRTKSYQYATTENPAPPIPDIFDEYYITTS